MFERSILGALLVGAASLAVAAEPPAELLAPLKQAVPGIEPDGVRESVVPGLYEVSVGPQVFYLSPDGRYMVRGDIIDIRQRENLTERTRRQARASTIAAIREQDMIVFAPAEPKDTRYTISVFTDVDCGYCAKLHTEVPELNRQGVAVRYLAFPRAGVGSASYDKTVSVWCSDDPHRAITDAKAGKSVPYKTCDNPVKGQYETGRNLGVTGTPTIVLESGEVVPGYVPSPRLLKMLEEDKAG